MRWLFPNPHKLSYGFTTIVLCLVFIHSLTAVGQENQTTQKLTLQECVELALKTHPQIAMTQAQLKEASAKYKEINANYFPKFSIGTSYSRLDYAPQFKTKYLGESLNDYQASLYLKQLIYDGGKTGRLKDWARKSIAVEEENLRDARRDLTYSVTRAYYNLIFADNMVKVKQEAVRQIESHINVENAMFLSGRAPKVDVLRAEVQLANVKQELSKAQNALQIASAQLNDLIGREIGKDAGNAYIFSPIAIDTEIKFEASVADLKSYMGVALESNPQLRRVKASIVATEAKVSAEKSAYWPNVSFKADYGYEWGDWPPKENVWHLGVVIDIPLWDGNATSARVNQAKATLEKIKATERFLAKQITLQVQKAYLSLKEAESRVSVTAKSVEQGKESLRIVEGSYKLGTGISRDVIDAQVALTQAQTNYLQALIDVQLAKADLERAVGKNEEAKK